MAILFHLADIPQDPVKGKKKLISAWISEVVRSERKKCSDINFIFCSNEYMLQMNLKYLNHNYFTDVITFSYNEDDILSGDIFVSVEQVFMNAERFNTSYHEELLRVIIHGVLHLIGYNDDSDSNRMHMHVLEDKALEKIMDKFE